MNHFDDLWKAELSLLRNDFIKAIAIPLDREENMFTLERSLLFSATIVRKLIEDVAISESVRSKSLDLTEYPSSRNSQPIFLEVMMGDLTVEDHFDLESPKLLRSSYFDLTSEIIHRDGLIWETDNDNNPRRFFVFSHRHTLRRLLAVNISQYVEILNTVIGDKPSKWTMKLDLNSGRIFRHAR